MTPTTFFRSNAVVMDNATVGAGSIVGALCFVPADMQIPERKVVVGNPARIVKPGQTTSYKTWRETAGESKQ